MSCLPKKTHKNSTWSGKQNPTPNLCLPVQQFWVEVTEEKEAQFNDFIFFSNIKVNVLECALWVNLEDIIYKWIQWIPQNFP